MKVPMWAQVKAGAVVQGGNIVEAGLDTGMDVWLVSSRCLYVVYHSVLQIKGGCHLGLGFSFAGHCSGNKIPNITLVLGKIENI